MKKPKLDEIQLNHEQSEALIQRVEDNQLTNEDRQLLAKLIRLFMWLTLSLREAKISLGRLRETLFGRGQFRKSKPPPSNDDEPGADAGASGSTASPNTDSSPDPNPDDETQQRRGHGRNGADAYTGAETIECRHDALTAGARCPLCGRGKLYAIDKAITIRIDGNALLSAVRYQAERLRCSACTDVFTAPLPPSAGQQKYSARAQVSLALSRYFLGVPFHRLEQLQAMVGVPVADATQWDQAEHAADAAWPVFEQLQSMAAQSALIYHDDTSVRVLSLMRENNTEPPPKRRGMYTTGLVACVDDRTIVLYFNGRAHAGENLAAVLARRHPHLPRPLVMSDALAANQAGGLPEHVRCHCLSHALRQFTEIESYFPQACQRVIKDLKAIYESDQQTRQIKLDPQQRQRYHQTHSQPRLDRLKAWLEQQLSERQVEPNSSLGKAMAYLDKHWYALTQFVRFPGAPLDSNRVERALKLPIRQRRNSLFFASTHSAYVAGLLASLIATCAESGVNAMDYLVALVENRSRVFANPQGWLPWNYTETSQAT